MEFVEYITLINNDHRLCSEYQKKLSSARSKKQIFELIADSNGMTFFQNLNKVGMETPYDDICRFFKNYINGLYKPKFEVEDGCYTSAVYCKHTDDILADTTQLSLLSCQCKVVVPKNHYVSLYPDKNSEIVIDNKGFGVNVFMTEGASVKTINGASTVKMIIK